MAYIFVDGCDSYTNATGSAQRYDVQNTTIVSNGGRFGGGCLATAGSGSWIQVTKQVPARATSVGVDDLYIGWSHRPTTVSTQPILTLANAFQSSNSSLSYTASPTTLVLETTSAGLLRVLRNNTAIATGTTVLQVGQWYRLEVKVSVRDTLGVYEVRLNGAPEITFSGDTYQAGDAQINCITWFGGRNDDIIVWDSIARGNEPTTWLGDVRIDTLRPVADGSQSDSMPVSDARWQNVADQQADESSSYNSIATIGDGDYYTCSNLTDIPASIHGVVVTARWRSMGTTGRKGKIRINVGSDEAVTDPIDMYTGAWGNSQAFFTEDPSTSAAWDAGGVDSLEIGWDLDT